MLLSRLLQTRNKHALAVADQLKRLEVAQRTLSDSGLELQHVSARTAGEQSRSPLPAGLLAH